MSPKTNNDDARMERMRTTWGEAGEALGEARTPTRPSSIKWRFQGKHLIG